MSAAIGGSSYVVHAICSGRIKPLGCFQTAVLFVAIILLAIVTMLAIHFGIIPSAINGGTVTNIETTAPAPAN